MKARPPQDSPRLNVSVKFYGRKYERLERQARQRAKIHFAAYRAADPQRTERAQRLLIEARKAMFDAEAAAYMLALLTRQANRLSWQALEHWASVRLRSHNWRREYADTFELTA